MTFSQLAKEEIRKSLSHNKQCCERAFLYGISRMLGSYSIGRGGIGLVISSEHRELLEMTATSYHKLYNKVPTISATDKNPLTNNTVFSLNIDKPALFDMQMIYIDMEGNTQLGGDNFCDDMVGNACCKNTFIKTVFLCCGSVVIPDLLTDMTVSGGGTRYHLEIVFSQESLANEVLQVMFEAGFDLKQTTRKNNYVLYIKDSETIADILVYMNCMKAKLQLENVVIERDVRNRVNRQSNCNFANIDKQVIASQKQVEAIHFLLSTAKLDTLTTALQDVAYLRLANQDATLEELATMSNMSKSGMRHRLNRLVELANQ